MKKYLLSSLVFCIICFSQFLSAQDTPQEKSQEGEDLTTVVQNPILTDKFLFSTGIFGPFNKITLGADGQIITDRTDDIKFDERFKLDGIQSSFTLSFTWRFAKNYSVNTDYFSVRTSNTVSFEKTVEWNGLTYEAGAAVKGGYEFALYKVFFGRVITRGNKHEFGGGLGFHTIRVAGFIEGLAYVNDEAASFKRSKVNATLPLPNIGFWYFWAPNEKWAFTGRVDWFGITISNFSGDLLGLTPGVNYQAFKNIGLSLEYKYLALKAEVDKNSWKGNVNMDFYGPSFKVTANF